MHTHLRQVIDQVETGAYTPTSSTGTSSAARPDGTHNHSQTYNTSVQTYGRCTYSPVTNTHAPDQNIQQNTHRHGLKFQAVSLPIGLCVLHGPLLGPDHDATIPRLSTIEQNLSDMTARQRHLDPNFQPYCVYGDTAYYDNTHVNEPFDTMCRQQHSVLLTTCTNPFGYSSSNNSLVSPSYTVSSVFNSLWVQDPQAWSTQSVLSSPTCIACCTGTACQPPSRVLNKSSPLSPSKVTSTYDHPDTLSSVPSTNDMDSTIDLTLEQ